MVLDFSELKKEEVNIIITETEDFEYVIEENKEGKIVGVVGYKKIKPKLKEDVSNFAEELVESLK